MASPFPSTVYADQARDFYLTVVYQTEAGSPVNITGYTATFSIAPAYEEAPAVTLTTGSGITITGSTGTIAIHATATQTNINSGQYVAELVIANAGIKTSLLKGPFKILPKVVE